MNLKLLIGLSFLCLACVAAAVFYSKHGLRDAFHLRSLMRLSEQHIERLEAENQELRRKLDLLDLNRMEILEDQLRQRYGYLMPNEILYLEPSGLGDDLVLQE